MERDEESAQEDYAQLREAIPEAGAIIRDEGEHESALIALLDEELLPLTTEEMAQIDAITPPGGGRKVWPA